MSSHEGILTGLPRQTGTAVPRRRPTPGARRAASHARPIGRKASRKPILTFQRFFTLLIGSFLALIVWLLVWGGSYYSTPLPERVFHPLHPVLRPSGSVGHNIGIAGTAMMLMIFLYSLRKQSKFLQKIGTQAHWLQLHIFLGIAGPVLVTFHTTGKLGGLVAVAFYAMWAIVVSGLFGRYLYAKIPRTVQGNKMTLKEIEDQLARLVDAVRASERKHEVLEGIEMFLAHSRRQKGGLIKALGRLFLDDLQLPLNILRIWKIVGRDRALSVRRRLAVSWLVLRQRRTLDKLAVLDASQQLFSFWHIFHKPFTIMTFVIAFLHIGLAIYLGFGPKW